MKPTTQQLIDLYQETTNSKILEYKVKDEFIYAKFESEEKTISVTLSIKSLEQHFNDKMLSKL